MANIDDAATSASRTVRLTDSEWATITEAAIKVGFGKNGRGKCLVFLAKRALEDIAAKEGR